MKKFLVLATAALFLTGMASCSSTSTEENTQETVRDFTEAFDDNAALGHEFLEKNAKNDSVVQTASGLQYMVLKEGTGAKPGPTDQVTVEYTGKLIDGTVFDTSEGRGPATFGLNQVIAGWTEGLQLMSEGAEYRLFVPSELAYGTQGQGNIAPNSTLIFDVKLIKVLKSN